MTLNKFAVCSPVVAGTFPAAALQYRRGDVEEARNVIYQVLNLEDLYAMKGSGTSTVETLDDSKLRRRFGVSDGIGAINELDPLSFYVGRVVRTFGGDPEKSTQEDLTKYIDRQNRAIASVTGQLSWDYGTGIAIVDAPRSQGAAGFLSKAGGVELADVTIESYNDFSSIMVISLDGQPLKTSRSILIQAMTEEQLYGFRSEGGSITNLGEAPFGVKKIDARVSLRFEDAGDPEVTALDENGYAAQKAVTVGGDGVTTPLVIELAEDAIYHVVQRAKGKR